MASTYVNNLRLEEIGTGEQSGTWGDTTNTNLEIIGQATAWGTRAIANASTDNITIADGALDADRCLGLKLTGGGQACTVTLLPNTSSKTWFMYNATAADLTFTCGSGANVVIPAGQTKVIATDGLGSGGVVHDLLTAVNLAGTTVVDDLTVSDDLTVTDDAAIGGLATVGGTLGVTGIATFTDDIIIGDGKTIGSASTVGAITIASDGDITLSADLNVGANFDVTGNAVIDGTALVTGVLTTTAATVFNGGFAAVQESTVIVADGQSDNDYAFKIKNEESTDDRSYGLLIHAGSTGTDRALAINTHDGNAGLFYVQGNGQALFTDGTASLPSITNNGDVNTGIFFPAADTIAFAEGGEEYARITSNAQLSIGAATPIGIASSGVGKIAINAANAIGLSIANFANNAGGSVLTMGHSRSGTVGTAGTTVNNSDTLGTIRFAGDDGTDMQTQAALINCAVDGTPGSNDMPANLTFHTNRGAASPTESMRIKADGSVNISSDGASLTIGGTTAATDANLTLQDPEPAIMFHDSTGGQNDGAIQVENGQMRFLTGANANNVADLTVQVKIHNGGNLEIDDGDLVIGTAGHGIDFSAQTASSTSGASTSSEILDHYEEGTWTPVINGTSSAGSGTYSTQRATYTRIGRVVTFEYAITWTNHTGSGSLQVGGFPFTSGNQTYYTIQLEAISLTSNNIAVAARVEAGEITSLLIQSPVGGGNRAAIAMDTAGSINGGGTYQV